MTTAPTPVSFHPEAVPGDPACLRWVVPRGLLSIRGEVAQAPGEFGQFVARGEVTAVVEADAVVTRLHSGTWALAGPTVRAALGAALGDPAGWVTAGERAAVVGVDARLQEAAQHVIDGDAGDYVRSHGGTIELVGVRDGRVEVALGGACGACPAVSGTLHHRVESAVRAACPDVVEVRAVSR